MVLIDAAREGEGSNNKIGNRNRKMKINKANENGYLKKEREMMMMLVMVTEVKRRRNDDQKQEDVYGG